jgi:hypothetical protein
LLCRLDAHDVGAVFECARRYFECLNKEVHNFAVDVSRAELFSGNYSGYAEEQRHLQEHVE